MVLTDGRVLHGTPIREWDPVLTSEDYAALARCPNDSRGQDTPPRGVLAASSYPGSSQHHAGSSDNWPDRYLPDGY